MIFHKIFHKMSPIITISNKIIDQQEGIALIFIESFQLSGMEINLGKLMWILGLIRLRGRNSACKESGVR